MKQIAFLILVSLIAACGPSQAEHDALKKQNSDLEAELSDIKAMRAKLEKELEAIKARNAELTGQLETAGADLSETQRALTELQERERQAQARLDTFKNLLSRFKAMIESGKLRVRVVRNRMVVELPEGVLFDSGKAEVKTEGQKTLAEVAGVLKDIKDREFQIAGHTDNIPVRRRFKSNWELSTARAVTVAQFLIKEGMSKSRLSAAGYADSQPVASNKSKEGRAKNRRIEIVLVPNLDELPNLSSLEEK